MNHRNSLAFLCSKTIPFEEKKSILLSDFQSLVQSRRVDKFKNRLKNAEFNWKWHLSHHDKKFRNAITQTKIAKKIQEECIHFYGIEMANSALAQMNRRVLDPRAYNAGLSGFRQWDRDSVLLAIVVNKVFMCINKNPDRVREIVGVSTVKETRNELLNIELIPGVRFRDLKASGTILDKLDKYYEDEDFIYDFDQNIGSNEENKRFNAFQKHKRIIRKSVLGKTN